MHPRYVDRVEVRQVADDRDTVVLEHEMGVGRLLEHPVGHAEAQGRDGVNRLEIDGQIPADGKTTLSARGTTGASTYTLNNLAPGSPYAFTVDAQFDRNRGSGKRNEARACNLVFVKR